MQECLDRISASKKKPVKKAVPVEEPSSDDDTSDRISPSAMPLKKRPAKKTVQEEEQLSDDGSSDSSPANLEKGGRALSPFFGPIQKPKYESYCTTISSRCFIS